MRVILILLGLLLMVGGGAVAGAQFAPPDLLKMLDSAPQQARDFLQTPTALYAGGGAAGFGLLLVIIALATGGKKKKPEKARAAPVAEAAPETMPAPAPTRAEPVAPKPAPAPQPAMAAAPPPAPKPAAPAPMAASPQPEPPQPEPPKAKPQASAHPPASAQTQVDAPAAASTLADAARVDPRLRNRKRVSDLVTINDALQAYFRKHGSYPAAEGLAGVIERGAAWIPGLAPDFLPELPIDPAMAAEGSGPQYVYVSDGKDYKLLALNVSLVGGTSVEVLGVKVDRSRQPTMENASFGFWTPGFAAL